MTNPLPTRGRFAPSPTGPLHLGSLVAALASFLLAKSQQGQWLIRIEDLDPPRELKGMAEQQIKVLEQFGLISDQAIVWQSQRSALYEQALERLLMEDKAFYCACSRKQLQSQAGIHRFCQTPENRQQSSIRLRLPDTTMEFDDGLYGRQQQNLAREVGDMVLKRADGYYAYQLAVVVDDAAQGITQLVRGADLLDSSLRQIFLQQQLGFKTPSYWHIPLVLNESGQKLSKSQWAKALDEQDRFNALFVALRHLGQDTQRLNRQNSMLRNLEIALESFSLDTLKQTTVRG